MKSVWVIASALLIGLLSGCSTGTGPSEDYGFEFPLTEGNSWDYSSEYLAVVMEGARDLDLDTLDITYHLEVAQHETILDTLACYRVVEISVSEPAEPDTSISYYKGLEDGLYLHAYRPGLYWGFVGVAPKQVARPTPLFQGRPLADMCGLLNPLALPSTSQMPSDSLYVEDPPVRSYAYPLWVGRQWTIREPGNPWAVDKRVTRQMSVSVPAGDYTCYVIQWLIDFGDDGEWDEDILWLDYVSDGELVKRSFTWYDVVFVDIEGTPIDTVDVWQETVLTESDVQ